jgi:hypothetical protein
MAHCSDVPLQVFSGETTPILRIGSLIIIEGLPTGDNLPFIFSIECIIFWKYEDEQIWKL